MTLPTAHCTAIIDKTKNNSGPLRRLTSVQAEHGLAEKYNFINSDQECSGGLLS